MSSRLAKSQAGKTPELPLASAFDIELKNGSSAGIYLGNDVASRSIITISIPGTASKATTTSVIRSIGATI